MMFLKESLYGWGVCDIPMPRSEHDIFSDRRKRSLGTFGTDRRGQNDEQGILSIISGIVGHDIPWFQSFFTIVVSFLSIVFVLFLSTLIPDFTEKKVPEPVEILINLTEKFDKIPPVHRPLPKAEETIPEEKPKPVVKPKQEKAPVLKQEPTVEEFLPDIKIQSGIKRKPLKAMIAPDLLDLSLEKPTQDEVIEISIPVAQTRRYNSENTCQAVPEIVPKRSSLVLERTDDQPMVDPLRQQQEKYNLKTKPRSDVAPSAIAESFSVQSDISAETVSTANLPSKHYKRNTPNQAMAIPHEKTDPFLTQPQDSVANISRNTPTKKNYNADISNRVVAVPTGRTESFLNQQKSPVATITPAGRTQKTHKRNLNPGNRVQAAPSVKADSFLAKSDVVTEVLSPASPSQRSYPIDVARQYNTLTPNHMSDSKAFAAVSPSDSAEVPLSKPDQTSRQYALNHQSSVLPGPANQNQFQLPQKDGRDQGEDLKVGVIARQVLKAAQGNATAVSVPTGSHDFLDISSMDEIDPSQLISLKELAVCADPEEEFHLKTRLATLLGGPAKCNSDGILFFFKYTESGYTIQVNIYNPKGAPLEDRCAVLRSAIKCVENLKAKGIRP